MHRHEANRVVVVRERRGLGLARPRLRERDAIEERADRRLLVRDAEELSHVRDALNAARQKEKRLLHLELAHGLAERAARTESVRRSAKRAEHAAHAFERGTIFFFDETAPFEHVPSFEIGHEAAVRLGETEER